MNEIMLFSTEEPIDIGVIEKFLRALPEKALHLGVRIVLALLVFAIGAELIKLTRKIVKKSLIRAGADKGVMQFLDSFLKAALYLILIFMIAASFGLDATGILAVLGSAGVAIGLALQGSLSNFAGGVLILLLKPFKVGDYIIEDSKGNQGTVTEIQLFYTKLATPDDKVVVLPNGALANTSLTNVTATEKRRMDIQVGISYQADIRKTKEVLTGVLRQEAKLLKQMEQEVYVEELGSSAVIFGVRCWFLNEDYWAGKWRVTENIKLALDDAEIEMAYPQMDIHIKSEEQK